MANNQYNFLDYAGLSLFWNNVKSIIEENELATASALTDLDTRVDNVESSKSDKGHTHDYLPLSGGTITGYINLLNSNGKLAFGNLATSPITGYKAPALSANGVGIYSRYGGSSDEGAIIITEDTCAIYNSADTGWNFQVMDKDLGTDMTNDEARSFGVTQNHQTWSLGGFIKSGSSDYYVLLGGGGHKAVSDFATAEHTHISLTPERFDSDNPLPNSKNGLTFQFSYNLGSGASGWWNVLNMRSYYDNNYTSSQIITPADNPGTDTGYSGDMKWRQGRNSTWLDWKTILDSNNYTTYCTPANIGAAPFAHTHTKSQITDFAHTHTKSQITDFPTSLPASDVKAWAKADTKPSYTGTEVTLSGYSKNNSYTPIASGDSVQAAIAKLEGAINGLEDLLASI